jgi:hypothetical protein
MDDAFNSALYQYTPPSAEEQEKRRRLDAAFAAGAAMLAASGGNRNLAQALGAGGLAAANSRFNSNASARDDMAAGYQMEQLQRQNAQQRQLEQVLPELIKSEFSRDSIAGAAQRAPAAALNILDMADKRNKAKLEQTKTEAQIQNDRLKVAEKFANKASYYAKLGDQVTPKMVQTFAEDLEKNGVSGILGQLPFQSWGNPKEASSNFSAMASMFYDIKDQTSQAETGRHNLTTEQQAAARDAATRAQQEEQLKISRGNLAVAQQNANAPRFQMVGEQAYTMNPRTGILSPAAAVGVDGRPMPLRAEPKVSETTLAKMATNEAALASIQRARQLTRDAPASFGLKNLLPDIAMQRLDPSGVDPRAEVGKVGATKIHDLSGAAVTVSEFPRLAVFVPNVKDTPEAIDIKLANLEREMLQVQSELAAGKSLATMIRERTRAEAVNPMTVPGQPVAPTGQRRRVKFSELPGG